MLGNVIADCTVSVQPVQWSRSAARSGSHFHPWSNLFQPNEKGVLACHGWPPRWTHRRDGASLDTQAIRCSLLGMCVWYLLLLHLSPHFLQKVLVFVDRYIGMWGWSAASEVSSLNFPADFCYVAGLCHNPALPRPQPQASLVSQLGKINGATIAGIGS